MASRLFLQVWVAAAVHASCAERPSRLHERARIGHSGLATRISADDTSTLRQSARDVGTRASRDTDTCRAAGQLAESHDHGRSLVRARVGVTPLRKTHEDGSALRRSSNVDRRCWLRWFRRVPKAAPTDFPSFTHHHQHRLAESATDDDVAAGLVMLQTIDRQRARGRMAVTIGEIEAVRAALARVADSGFDADEERLWRGTDLVWLPRPPMSTATSAPPVVPSRPTRALLHLLHVLCSQSPASSSLDEYAHALQGQGAYHLASDVYGLAITLARSEGDSSLMGYMHRHLGHCLGVLDRPREATHAYHVSIASAEQGTDEIEVFLSHIGLGILDTAYRAHDAARERLDWVIDCTAHGHYPVPRAFALYARSVLARDLGDHLRARLLWHQAAAIGLHAESTQEFLRELASFRGIKLEEF